MSSSRSLASARNKRAGGNTVGPSVPSQSTINAVPGTTTSPVSGIPQKISVSQAITMIDQRISNLETLVNENKPLSEELNGANEETENKYLVDAEVFDDIVKRLTILEQEKNSPITTSHGVTADSFILDGMQSQVNELKNALLKLQSFTMDTNARLSGIVFQNDAVHEDANSLFINPVPTATGASSSGKAGSSLDVEKSVSASTSSVLNDLLEKTKINTLERPVLSRDGSSMSKGYMQTLMKSYPENAQDFKVNDDSSVSDSSLQVSGVSLEIMEENEPQVISKLSDENDLEAKDTSKTASAQ